MTRPKQGGGGQQIGESDPSFGIARGIDKFRA
jgi:hypothetical protein